MVLAAGCRHRVDVEPTPSGRSYCWWASQYVETKPIETAGRFVQGLSRAGFRDASFTKGDNDAWSVRGTGVLPKAPTGTRYGMRVYVFAAGDTARCNWRGMAGATVISRPGGAESCFHTELLIYAPRGGWAPGDSTVARDQTLPLCGAVYGGALEGIALLK